MAENRGADQDRRQLFCRIITPERIVYDDETDLVVVRIADGDLGVMVNHAPTVSTVGIHEVRVGQGDERQVFATSDGFFKVSENLVQVLVEEAVPADEIDVNEAEDRIEKAEQELADLSDEGMEFEREEIERRQRTAENLVRVSQEHGGGEN
ncbi:MAG: ATP synthase F1 subunit epsilon [Rubrobacteraceae bacterium]